MTMCKFTEEEEVFMHKSVVECLDSFSKLSKLIERDEKLSIYSSMVLSGLMGFGLRMVDIVNSSIDEDSVISDKIKVLDD